MSPPRFTRRTLLLTSVAAGVLVMAGHPSASAEPKRGGTLTWAFDRESSSILGINTSAYITSLVGPKIFDGLLSYDENLNPQPQLATEWSVAPDSLTYIFKLRPNVKWHDGKPLTSSDVVFSIDRIKRVHPRGSITFGNVSSVETPDDRTVVFKLASPVPYFLTAFASSETLIIPKHIFEKLPEKDNPPDSALVGTGPFVFKEWVRSSHIVLERNPSYWDAGKPYLDRVIFRVIPDPASRSAGLEAGEIDLTSIGLTDIERLKANPRLVVEDKPSAYGARHHQISLNLEVKELSDVRVRKAIAHAIDLEKIQRVVFYGYGKVAPSPISPLLTKFVNPTIRPYSFDPALSNKLLDEAGYPKGANGFRFSLQVVNNPANDPRFPAFVAQSLKAVGIDASVGLSDQAAFIKRVYSERNFGLAIDAMGNGFDPTVGVQRVYWSKNFRIGVPFSNASRYENPEVDRLLEQASVEINEAKRRELFFKFQDIVNEELPVINGFNPPDFIAYRKGLQNFATGAAGLNGSLAEAFYAN
ncbi:ABC transporter substrate-binding protein [Rhizobium rhizogenes]|uniref:ABC transporter substrate-binding protein n=1 Tax=Rhizobium rhizogenes TaxID=359 RepID=UPI001573C7CC|nr:ABC transporter substrate-binding protein [Rhizobium rhizogenes]NTI78668.1 ABC transporter substrate-binding protein [Rhizobium rhizogenes]